MQSLGSIRPLRAVFCAAVFAASGLASAAETVKIGFIEVLSGAFAFTGQSSLKQLREVVLQLNASATLAIPRLKSSPSTARVRRRKARSR